MQRYFVDYKIFDNQKIEITGDDYYHITKVMRMKVNDEVIVCDNYGSYKCCISSISDNSVFLSIVEKLTEQKELPVEVTICQGLVRREKMEEVIDKITQLGATRYIPVNMERSLVKLKDEKIDKKLDRMNKIAKEASEQSHRTKKLIVEKPISFKEFLKMNKTYDLCLFAYEITSKDLSLKEVLKNNQYRNILILIGPEGGISQNEVNLLEINKFLPVSLGPRILRTEVAPSYIMAAISYELEV